MTGVHVVLSEREALIDLLREALPGVGESENVWCAVQGHVLRAAVEALAALPSQEFSTTEKGSGVVLSEREAPSQVLTDEQFEEGMRAAPDLPSRETYVCQHGRLSHPCGVCAEFSGHLAVGDVSGAAAPKPPASKWRRILCAVSMHTWCLSDDGDVRAGLRCIHCGRNGHSFI